MTYFISHSMPHQPFYFPWIHCVLSVSTLFLSSSLPHTCHMISLCGKWIAFQVHDNFVLPDLVQLEVNSNIHLHLPIDVEPWCCTRWCIMMSGHVHSGTLSDHRCQQLPIAAINMTSTWSLLSMWSEGRTGTEEEGERRGEEKRTEEKRREEKRGNNGNRSTVNWAETDRRRIEVNWGKRNRSKEDEY